MTCPFCMAYSGNRSKIGEPEDTLLVECEDFFAKPGLGHFLPGYTLICSKQHVASMSSLSPLQLDKLEIFRDVVSRRLQIMYGGATVAFEHGTSLGTGSGACIDHAHLHILPLPFNIERQIVLQQPSRTVERLRDLALFASGSQSYFYNHNELDGGVVFTLTKPLYSQYARRMYCERASDPDVWDWAIFPFQDRIEAFLELYWSTAGSQSWPKYLSTSDLKNFRR